MGFDSRDSALSPPRHAATAAAKRPSVRSQSVRRAKVIGIGGGWRG
ncbi:MAG: hypothetical protein R3B70_30350 [Polyangiaceae bacterium]